MTGEEGGEGGEGEGENCHPLITSLLNEGAVIKKRKGLKKRSAKKSSSLLTEINFISFLFVLSNNNLTQFPKYIHSASNHTVLTKQPTDISAALDYTTPYCNIYDTSNLVCMSSDWGWVGVANIWGTVRPVFNQMVLLSSLTKIMI